MHCHTGKSSLFRMNSYSSSTDAFEGENLLGSTPRHLFLLSLLRELSQKKHLRLATGFSSPLSAHAPKSEIPFGRSREEQNRTTPNVSLVSDRGRERLDSDSIPSPIIDLRCHSRMPLNVWPKTKKAVVTAMRRVFARSRPRQTNRICLQERLQHHHYYSRSSCWFVFTS